MLPNLLLWFGIPDRLCTVHYLHYWSLGACQRFAVDSSEDQCGDRSAGRASFPGLITQPGWEAWKRTAKRSQEKHSFPLQLSSCAHAFSTAYTFTSQRKQHKNMANALSKVSCCVEELFGCLLPRTVSCCSHVHWSETKAPKYVRHLRVNRWWTN